MIAGSNLRKNGRLSLLLLGSALLAALGSLLGLSLGFLGATFLGFAFRLSGDGFASATLGSHFESWICNWVRVCVLHMHRRRDENKMSTKSTSESDKIMSQRDETMR